MICLLLTADVKPSMQLYQQPTSCLDTGSVNNCHFSHGDCSGTRKIFQSCFSFIHWFGVTIIRSVQNNVIYIPVKQYFLKIIKEWLWLHWVHCTAGFWVMEYQKKYFQYLRTFFITACFKEMPWCVVLQNNGYLVQKTNIIFVKACSFYVNV